MTEIVKNFEHILWSYFAIPTLMLISLIFTFYFKGAQFKFRKMIQCLTKKIRKATSLPFNPSPWLLLRVSVLVH